LIDNPFEASLTLFLSGRGFDQLKISQPKDVEEFVQVFVITASKNAISSGLPPWGTVGQVPIRSPDCASHGLVVEVFGLAGVSEVHVHLRYAAF
jgi:hypothetical protein